MYPIFAIVRSSLLDAPYPTWYLADDVSIPTVYELYPHTGAIAAQATATSEEERYGKHPILWGNASLGADPTQASHTQDGIGPSLHANGKCKMPFLYFPAADRNFHASTW